MRGARHSFVWCAAHGSHALRRDMDSRRPRGVCDSVFQQSPLLSAIAVNRHAESERTLTVTAFFNKRMLTLHGARPLVTYSQNTQYCFTFTSKDFTLVKVKSYSVTL